MQKQFTPHEYSCFTSGTTGGEIVGAISPGVLLFRVKGKEVRTIQLVILYREWVAS